MMYRIKDRHFLDLSYFGYNGSCEHSKATLQPADVWGKRDLTSKDERTKHSSRYVDLRGFL